MSSKRPKNLTLSEVLSHHRDSLDTIPNLSKPIVNPSFTNSPTFDTMSLDSTFKFGKHKGEQLVDVIDSDLGYIDWLVNNDVVEFAEEVWVYIEHTKR